MVQSQGSLWRKSVSKPISHRMFVCFFWNLRPIFSYLFQVDRERHVLVPVTVVQRRALPPRASRGVVHRVSWTVRLGRVTGPGVANAALLSRWAKLAIHFRSFIRLATGRVRCHNGPGRQVEYLRINRFDTTTTTTTTICA